MEELLIEGKKKIKEVQLHCDNCEKLIGYAVIEDGFGKALHIISCKECRPKQQFPNEVKQE